MIRLDEGRPYRGCEKASSNLSFPTPIKGVFKYVCIYTYPYMREGKKLHQKGSISKGVVFIKYSKLERPYPMHGREEALRALIATEYSPDIFYINKA
jgi:hypothetical protein